MWRIIAFDRDDREVSRAETNGGDVTIGRDPDRQLVLPSASVSRRHAKLTLEGSQPFIADDGSANGVLVNGVRISGPTAVTPGVRIDIAEFRLALEQVGAPAEKLEPIRLVAEGGAFDGRVYEFSGGGDLIVGRAVDNDVVLDDPSLSRKHCRMRRGADGRIEIEDLGSSNGTFINGRRMNRGVAGPRDKIRFGELSFRIEGAVSATRRTDVPSRSLAIIAWGVAGAIVLACGVALAVYASRRATAAARDSIGQLMEQAAGHLRAGKEQLAAKKFEAATRELDEALKIDPSNSEVLRLHRLAESEPQSEKIVRQLGLKLDVGERTADRMRFEEALHLYSQVPVDSSFRADTASRLARKLLGFAETQCRSRRLADCAWAICKTFEVAPQSEQPAPEIGALLAELERRLVKDPTYIPCKKRR